MKRFWIYYVYLFLIWGSFRYFIKLPEAIEELWFKPLIWLVPLFWWNLAIKKKIEMFGPKWLETLTWGLGMALVYWVIVGRLSLQWGSVGVEALLVAVATAIVEETVFCGFLAGYLESLSKGDMWNNLLIGLMAAFLRLPILFFVYRADVWSSVGVFVLVFSSTMINAWIRQRTGNVVGSIMARVGLNLVLLG